MNFPLHVFLRMSDLTNRSCMFRGRYVMPPFRTFRTMPDMWRHIFQSRDFCGGFWTISD